MSKLLFISGTTTGGSGRSQRELAARLQTRGHQVCFVVDDKRPARASRWFYERLSDLSVRIANKPYAGLVERVRDSIQQEASVGVLDRLLHYSTAYPQNALPRLLETYRPDVVVANSVERWAWRRIHNICAHHQIPTILHIREQNSLPHLETGCYPTVLLANTPSLVQRLRDRGFKTSFVPSLVEIAITQTASTREKALAINSDPLKGGDFVWEVAAQHKDIPFVLQEAWELSAFELSSLQQRLVHSPNVMYRPRQEPGPALYQDARVLLVPYRVDSRPRVILEAQSNGIPVVAADVPALREAVGGGGVVLPMRADLWASTLERLWSNKEWYDELSKAALKHSHRSEVDPDEICVLFEVAVDNAMTSVV